MCVCVCVCVCVQYCQQGRRDSLPKAPSIRGPPNVAGLVQIISGLSVTFQSSFFKGFVSLYFQLKPACFFALRFMLQMQTITWLLRSPLAWAPYVILFNLKPIIKDGNFLVYMHCVHA